MDTLEPLFESSANPIYKLIKNPNQPGKQAGQGENIMKIFTIKAKMSGTGSIHDLASDKMDQEIKFPAGKKFAVVLAAYYGEKRYTVHASERLAARESCRCEFSHKIIDSDGRHYVAHGDKLVLEEQY